MQQNEIEAVKAKCEEIKAEFEHEKEVAIITGKESKARKLRAELVDALSKGISTHRLEEICQAERENRLVVLPCKVGDTVYRIGLCECNVCPNLNGKEISDDGIGYDCKDECPRIIEETPFELWQIDNKERKLAGIYFTKEDAEKALLKEGDK